MNDKFYMDEALKEAQLSLEAKNFPVGAVVVIDGEIAGRGHRDYSKNFHLDHAEIMALREALENHNYSRKENDVTIYITLEPCMMCFGTILHTPVRKVVYATHDPYGGAVSVIKQNHIPNRHIGKYPEIISSVKENESKKLLKKFLKSNQEPFWDNPDNPLVKYIMKE